MPRLHTLEHDAEKVASWLRSVPANVGTRYRPVSDVQVHTGPPVATASFTFVDNDTNFRVVIEATDRPEWREETRP